MKSEGIAHAYCVAVAVTTVLAAQGWCGTELQARFVPLEKLNTQSST